MIQEPLDRSSTDEVLFHDRFDIIWRNLRVERLPWVNHHDGALRTEAETTGAPDLDLPSQTRLRDLRVQG